MPDDTVTLKRKAITLKTPKPTIDTSLAKIRLLDPPLEISRARIPGLNMVDETVIVRGSLRARQERG